MNGTKADIVMPQLAESVVSATVSKWLKQPGDRVEEYEPLCEIITDKVTAELPSTAEGVLGEILVGEGETVEVGTVICTVVLEADSKQVAAQGMNQGETPGVAQSVGQGAATNAAITEMPQAGALVATAAAPGMRSASAGRGGEEGSMRTRYSPAVRTLADEHGIDLRQLKGSGYGGRITRKDVLRYIESGAESPAVQPAQRAQGTVQQPSSPVSFSPQSPASQPLVQHGASSAIPAMQVDGNGEYFIDVTPVRHTIATRMRQSVSEIPHAWTMIEVDVTNLVTLRNRLKQDFMKREGINLTYLAFVIKAVVNAIKDYPILNSVWAVDKIIVKRDINISLAVGTEDAVYVPVIKQADQKNIAGLAREIDKLTKKARAGQLTPADMQNGTFTINNTGSFGSILSQPIINYPQAVNLTFESIVKKPVVIDDMIAVRSMANICLSLDHRILDGVICGRFLQRVKENIEAYGPDTKLY